MTFPGVVPIAVSGEEGQQEEKVLQARDQEVSFEALSMRPTEVSLIGPLQLSLGGEWGKPSTSSLQHFPFGGPFHLPYRRVFKP